MSKLTTDYLKRSCSTPLSTEEPSSLPTVETSSSSQRSESDVQTVQCQPGPDYPFPMSNLERKNAVVKLLGSRTFPEFTIPKKSTQFSVYFA